MSKATDTGGPVFPSEKGNEWGLILLDYFAGQALCGLMAIEDVVDHSTESEIAMLAYNHAEAMIAEKRKRESTINAPDEGEVDYSEFE